MRICDWSSDVCSSDLVDVDRLAPAAIGVDLPALERVEGSGTGLDAQPLGHDAPALAGMAVVLVDHVDAGDAQGACDRARVVHVGRCPVASIEQVDQQRTRRAVVTVHPVNERSDEHTYELQSTMRRSNAYFSLKKKKIPTN